MTTLDCARYTRDGVTIVSAAGDIDLDSAPRLRDALCEAIREPRPNVLLDLTAVGFVDSTGLAVLLASFRQARALGGSLRMVVPPRPSIVRKVIEITGLNRLFTVYASLAEAQERAASPLPQLSVPTGTNVPAEALARQPDGTEI
ncbi:MAG: STAS domain-containing protein [Jiangellaceae bacterium]|nr:STAS domain-containing protein [Jiangellaceae bacterium]